MLFLYLLYVRPSVRCHLAKQNGVVDAECAYSHTSLGLIVLGVRQHLMIVRVRRRKQPSFMAGSMESRKTYVCQRRGMCIRRGVSWPENREIDAGRIDAAGNNTRVC